MNTCCNGDAGTLPQALPGVERGSWRRALVRIGREALTLHRYRELRARALRDALADDLPCGQLRRGDRPRL